MKKESKVGSDIKTAKDRMKGTKKGVLSKVLDKFKK